jgi:hypothetical protein
VGGDVRDGEAGHSLLSILSGVDMRGPGRCDGEPSPNLEVKSLFLVSLPSAVATDGQARSPPFYKRRLVLSVSNVSTSFHSLADT